MAEWRVDVDPTGEDMASAALTAVVAEQSALRRVAELVARQREPAAVRLQAEGREGGAGGAWRSLPFPSFFQTALATPMPVNNHANITMRNH